jgi:nitrate/TMAO reductase-like tetraheme cytochrome c subunit
MTSVRTFSSLRAACAILLLCSGIVAAAAPAAKAPAAKAPPPPSVIDTCMMCHADKEAKGAAGKSIAVDAARFGKSVHGELQLKCTDCHADVSVDKLPHAEKLKPVDCASCHEKEVKQYAGTVHGAARNGGSVIAAKCTDCHGTHDILRSQDPDSRTNHANIEATCSTCHGSDAMAATGKLPGGNIGGKFHDSIHGKALQGAAQRSAPTCTNCHGAHDIHPKADAGSRTHRAKIPDTCGTCHIRERAAYVEGMHGKLRQDGVLAAPGCTDCHSAHSIMQHDTPRFRTEVVKECGTCHADYLATYRDTFHGQVTALGYSQVATCASCHGAHAVLPASNPASKVSAQNRVKTCQACHPGASANFASFDPHASKHDRARNPLYWYAAKFMEILLFGVFAFFGVHTVLWFYREAREKLQRGKSAGNGDGKERH